MYAATEPPPGVGDLAAACAAKASRVREVRDAPGGFAVVGMERLADGGIAFRRCSTTGSGGAESSPAATCSKAPRPD